MDRCHNCGQELVEIDNRGVRLTGCIICGRVATGRGGRGYQPKICAPCTCCDTAEAANGHSAKSRKPRIHLGGAGLPGSQLPPGNLGQDAVCPEQTIEPEHAESLALTMYLAQKKDAGSLWNLRLGRSFNEPAAKAQPTA